jgi:hypothetical protein
MSCEYSRERYRYLRGRDREGTEEQYTFGGEALLLVELGGCLAEDVWKHYRTLHLVSTSRYRNKARDRQIERRET